MKWLKDGTAMVKRKGRPISDKNNQHMPFIRNKLNFKVTSYIICIIAGNAVAIMVPGKL